MNNEILKLLHLSDSSYPTGSFGHSWGLEYAIINKWVKDEESLIEWSKDSIKYSFIPLEGRSSLKAWDIADESNFEELFNLDEELTSFRLTDHIRTSSAQMGRSFANITSSSYNNEKIKKLNNLINVKESFHCMQHPVVWGAIFNWLSITKKIMLESLLFGIIKQWAQVAVRIIPIGQKNAHHYLAQLTFFIEKTATEEITGYKNSNLQSICPGFDLACIGHESLKARYFIN